MPYVIRRVDDEWCVYKAGTDDAPTGETLGCHASEAEAKTQMAAIHGNEDKAAEDRAKRVARPSQAEVGYMPLSAIDGKACANCRWFAQNSEYGPACHLIDNYPQDVMPTGYCARHEMPPGDDAPMYAAAEASATGDEPFDDGFADAEPVETEASAVFVKELAEIDGMASGEAIGAAETMTSTSVEPDTAHVVMTSFDLKGGEVEIESRPLFPPMDGAAYIPRDENEQRLADTSGAAGFKAIVGTLERLFRREPETTAFKASGEHWFARWSNNFKDRDGEFFTEKAHDNFIARVKSGVVPYPELWVEHIPVRVGKAFWVGRLGHFVLAAGRFDDTPLGQAAKAYYAAHKQRGVSHGFSYDRKTKQGHVYHDYNTFEISPLDHKTPANPWTTLDAIQAKVIDMTLTEKDIAILKEKFGDELVENEILGNTEKINKALEALDLEFKDFIHPDEAQEIVEEGEKQAAETIERDFGALVVDLLTTQADLAERSLESARAIKQRDEAHGAEVDALKTRLDEQAEAIKTLQDQLDDRPRSASRDEATELDAERLKVLSEQVEKQLKVIDTFTGLEVDGTAL